MSTLNPIADAVNPIKDLAWELGRPIDLCDAFLPYFDPETDAVFWELGPSPLDVAEKAAWNEEWDADEPSPLSARVAPHDPDDVILDDFDADARARDAATMDLLEAGHVW
jgi:hypothetical protein